MWGAGTRGKTIKLYEHQFTACFFQLSGEFLVQSNVLCNIIMMSEVSNKPIEGEIWRNMVDKENKFISGIIRQFQSKEMTA